MNSTRKITKVGEWNDRMEMLGYDIMSLISQGENESVDSIVEHLNNADIVHYLIEKYKDKMAIVHEGCPYNLDEWEMVVEQYNYGTFGHDITRKMRLYNEQNDGLLVVLNIILQEVSERRYK